MSADGVEARTTHGARHWLGFLASGILAYVTDVGVGTSLATFAGLPWAVSRIGAILAAMVVAFLAHRRLTFAMPGKPTWPEFARYAGVAWSTAALNYAVFLALLWLWPALPPALAIAIASLVAMTYSYLGMRVAVFRR